MPTAGSNTQSVPAGTGFFSGTSTSTTTTKPQSARPSLSDNFSAFLDASHLHGRRTSLPAVPKMKAPVPTTEDEFEKLPPAIRRKYFSTLERLRLAQHPQKCSGLSLRHRHHLSSYSGHWRPRTTTESNSGFGSSPRRLRKLHSRNLITAADAQWFLELPETIRRKHFTREEQILLAGRCESVILDPTDEALYKLGRKYNHSSSSVSSTPTSPASLFFHDTKGDAARHTSLEMDDSIRETFRWMDEDEELDLSLHLDDYHTYIDKEVHPPETKCHTRKPSFRRTFSISAKPFRRSSSSCSNHAPTFALAPQPSHERKGSLSRHAPKLSISTTDKEAAYYQDPEARLKLRVYLASPQKFDEAIEFGFPATDGPTTETLARPKHQRKKSVTENARTFLDDDVSLFHDVDDDSTLPETESPLTPRTPRDFDPAFRSPHRLPSTSNPNSTDSAGPTHYNTRQRIHGDSYLHAFAGSREMTLRMTLTRPDLRADERVLYGFQRNSKDDPLALEDLPPMSDEVCGAIGPFGGPDGWGPPAKDGLVKKLWRKVKHGQK